MINCTVSADWKLNKADSDECFFHVIRTPNSETCTVNFVSDKDTQWSLDDLKDMANMLTKAANYEFPKELTKSINTSQGSSATTMLATLVNAESDRQLTNLEAGDK